MPPTTYSETDAILLDLLQTDFPIQARPFRRLGDQLGLSEQEVLRKVRTWVSRGLIRRIGASVDARRLGFHTTLVGADVRPEAVETVGRQVSQLRWVSHNYLRDHRINLWFTLTTPSEAVTLRVLEEVAAHQGVRKIYLLPMIRLFKLSVRFNPRTRKGDSNAGKHPRRTHRLTPNERAVLRALQGQIPVEREPYVILASSVQLDLDAFLDALGSLVRSRVIRRFGATLDHRRLGVNGNAMVVWQVPEQRLEEVGLYLAAQPEVSHAYERPTYPDWPYALYTMVHARDEAELHRLLETWAWRIQPRDYLALHTLREYKKEPVRLFD